MLIAARVTDEGDLRRMVADTTSMTKIMDGMGLFCFMTSDPSQAAPRYSPCKVPTSIELGRVVHDIAEQMRATAR